jgi:hypothetical protein
VCGGGAFEAMPKVVIAKFLFVSTVKEKKLGGSALKNNNSKPLGNPP